MTWSGNYGWSPTGGAAAPECGTAQAVESFNGLLVAGGDFCDPFEPHLITWDGSTWSTLGSGMNGSVRALTIYDGHLMAAGSFTQADNKPASLIAEWSQPVAVEARSWGILKALFRTGAAADDQ